jgi:FMN phosphatase YigB (HAD superfamily)
MGNAAKTKGKIVSARSAIIMDFDNTLYDWVGQWYAAFKPMFDEIVAISGLSPELLKSEIRKIHQRHHTSEYSFLIESLEVIRDGSIENTLAKYRPAIEKAQSGRRSALALYPGVSEALRAMKAAGKTLAVFTESQTFYTTMRFKKFELDGLIDFLFTSDDHATPSEDYLQSVRAHPADYYKITNTKHRSVGKGHLKPDPAILFEIVSEIGSQASECLYVGDSLYKDVAMAKDANIFAVWAEYGESRGQPGYDFLRDVSHWTAEDVEKDRVLKRQDVKADVILKNRFSELLDVIDV